jgi:hypothetical protein
MVTDEKNGSFLTRWAKALLVKLLILLAVVAAIVAFCMHGFSAFGLRFDPFHRLDHAVAAAQAQTGKAEVHAGQADAGLEALKAYDAHQARARATNQVHQENSHALLAQPGAAQALDPPLARTFHDGLCRYAAAGQDPGCTGLPAVPEPAAGEDPERAGPDGP